MIITYKQADGTVEQVSTLDLSAIESADIEEAMGGTAWRVIEDQLRGQDPTAMRAVLWAVRRRTEPTAKFSEFDVPGWRRRLKARLEREEIDDVLENIMAEALAASEDSAIESMLPFLRKLAEDTGDIDAALKALGKGHLVTGPAVSED
ncbi:hypothetical protein [Streptomyces rubiginosohelvolus]|uniref:Uncharacterized protein n=1 Tax=Streptomyces rubiginosohelvolus TaxID=67362 RepID=A0ABQ3BT71_9ACTN|nr:hypothetical protein [Streptomyces pluricolorescens]GGZ53289.1 hypothetical protein GCM10010328_30130 [Streptomyces pluricolorescens]